MDWFRRIFGYSHSYRSQEDVQPQRSPTWEEILDEKNSVDRQWLSDGDTTRGYNDMFIYPQEFDDNFSSVFDQMDTMFHQLDAMMRGFHEQPGQVIITELPDSEASPEPRSPRDSLLKVPDSEPTEDSSNPPTGPKYPGPAQPYSGSEDEEYERNEGIFGGFRNFGSFGGPGFFNPQIMIDDFFKNFGTMEPFGGFTVPQSPLGPDQHSRDTLVKKEDSDLDDRISGDLSELPKGGPQYSYGPAGSEDDSGSVVPQVHPGGHHSYRSTTVVRIRRPDGSIEETKKYTDSSGREEVTVTHTEPAGGSSSSDPRILPGEPAVPDGFGVQSPSLFSWIFTR